MSSDSILSGSAPVALSKDFGKKKRTTNRLAKLKQCKLDARREQWLSQVKSNKVFKDESNVVGGGGGSSPPLSSLHPINERDDDDDDQQRSSKNLETRSRGEENDGSSSLHDSDLEFLTSSPNNNNSSSRKGCCGSGSSVSSSSSNSSDCCSGTVSDEEEDDDGCLDDWEAVADALTVDKEPNHLNSEPSSEMVNSVVGYGPLKSANKVCGVGVLKQECDDNDNDNGRGVVENCRAWRPDDVSRPQSLPNLSKQYSFPMNSERRCGGREGIAWGCHNITSQPISCPICYEDLDLTDSSFMPCLCGFRLCLFCHKRILEADGRCPGCRKQYDSSENGRNGGAPRYRFSRSFSMSTGS